MKTAQTAALLGCPYDTVTDAIKSVYAKKGFSDIALLTRSAMQNWLDEELEPETWETRPTPASPRRGGRGIKWGRIRQSGLKPI